MSIFDYEQWSEHNILGVPLYSLELYKTPISTKEFNAITRRFRDICKEFECSGLLVLSTHASNKNLKTTYIKRKGVGRPQKIISGDVVEQHIHNAFVGRNAHRAATKSKKYLDKNFTTDKCKKISKIQCISDTDCHASNYINYCYEQADSVRCFGDFDFEKYTKFK